MGKARIFFHQLGGSAWASTQTSAPHSWVVGGADAINATALAFNVDENKEDLYYSLRDAVSNTFGSLYIDSKNLETAIRGGHEILFYQTDGYYSVPEKAVMDEMSKRGINHSGISGDEYVVDFLNESLAGLHDRD